MPPWHYTSVLFHGFRCPTLMTGSILRLSGDCHASKAEQRSSHSIPLLTASGLSLFLSFCHQIFSKTCRVLPFSFSWCVVNYSPGSPLAFSPCRLRIGGLISSPLVVLHKLSFCLHMCNVACVPLSIHT